MVVYILYSKVIAKHYTGHTGDLDVRLQQHNSCKTKSIKLGIPWEVVFTQECENRSEAMRLEKKIKTRGAKRFLEDKSLL